MNHSQVEMLLEILKKDVELNKERNALLKSINDTLNKIYGGMP